MEIGLQAKTVEGRYRVLQYARDYRKYQDAVRYVSNILFFRDNFVTIVS
jgi:hypothetical protein